MKDPITNVSNKDLDFESFLGELSAELVNLPLESIDATIESSMKKQSFDLMTNRSAIIFQNRNYCDLIAPYYIFK